MKNRMLFDALDSPVVGKRFYSIRFLVGTPGAILWMESCDEAYERSDYLILHKGEIQAMGKVSCV